MPVNGARRRGLSVATLIAVLVSVQIPGALLGTRVALAASAVIVGQSAQIDVKVNRTGQLSVFVSNQSTQTWSNSNLVAVLVSPPTSAFTPESWSAAGCTAAAVPPGSTCTMFVTVKPSDLGLGTVDFSVQTIPSSGAGFSDHVLLKANGIATYEVIQTDDANVCDELPGSPCTIRGAINSANAFAGRDAIGFKIPGSAPFSIKPLTALPFATDPVIIDATNTQGAHSVELDGTGVPAGTSGLRIQGGNSILRGLVVNGFPQYGIWLDSNGGNRLEGSFLGTDVTGTAARPNLHGLLAGAPGDTIGGTSASKRNIISGNSQ